MLLVIDIGNTNIVFGVYDGDTLVNHWRLGTVLHKTIDEYAILINSLLYHREDTPAPRLTALLFPAWFHLFSFPLKSSAVNTSVSCLLSWDQVLRQACRFSLIIRRKLGADRIVNAVAGYEKYKKALIIVDFGTATTFDYVTPKGEYVGGCHCAGHYDISGGAL